MKLVFIISVGSIGIAHWCRSERHPNFFLYLGVVTFLAMLVLRLKPN